jgi:hypothetical protein
MHSLPRLGAADLAERQQQRDRRRHELKLQQAR